MRSITMTVSSGIVLYTALLGAHDVARGVELGSERGASAFASIETSSPLGAALGVETLDGLRAGEALMQTHVDNDGLVDGNTADGVVSGANLIGDGAFSNASGISTVIQNSGANVLIQNGTAVNVQFVDPMP